MGFRKSYIPSQGPFEDSPFPKVGDVGSLGFHFWPVNCDMI